MTSSSPSAAAAEGVPATETNWFNIAGELEEALLTCERLASMGHEIAISEMVRVGSIESDAPFQLPAQAGLRVIALCRSVKDVCHRALEETR